MGTIVMALAVMFISTLVMLIQALKTIKRLQHLCNFYFRRYTQAVDSLEAKS